MMELIKTRSGKWYSISQKDISFFVSKTKNILQKNIRCETKIGIYIDLDNAQLLSMIIYQACVACGASIIRCGISDFDRQLPIKSDIPLDLLICTKAAYQYIAPKVRHNKYIIVDIIENIEGQIMSENDITIYELFDIPGFLIADFGSLYCPGYTLKKIDSMDTICINSCDLLEGFKVVDYELNLHLPNLNDLKLLNPPVINYIKLQISILLKEVLNGKIDKQDNIIMSSIGMVELLVILEEEFGISIPMEKVNKNGFKSLDSLSNLIYSTILEK